MVLQMAMVTLCGKTGHGSVLYAKASLEKILDWSTNADAAFYHQRILKLEGCNSKVQHP